MPSDESPARYRWRRFVAACGVVTSLVALAAIGDDGQTHLVSLWLLCSGLALAALSLHAIRKERRAGELLACRQAERDLAEDRRRAAEAFSMELAETSPDIVAVHGADGRVVSVSAASRAVLGYDPAELVGRPGDDFVHGEDLPIIVAMRNRAREADDVSATFRLVRHDGRPIWVEAKLRIVRDAGGAVSETHAIVRDVHERVEAQRALAEAEERFRTAFEEGAAGMAIVSTGGELLRVNRALCLVTGHEPAELEGRSMLSLLHPDDRPQYQQERERMLAGEIVTARGERRYRHEDGRVVWVSVSTTLVRDAGGGALHFLTQAHDVTERRRYEAELRHMADHDALTGLLNRRAFERELERHVDHVGRYGPRGAAVLIDIDLFKNVNDTLGHRAGDQLIGKVADALREHLRDGEVIARLGGDEFAVLVPDGGPRDAEASARRAARGDPRGSHLEPHRPAARRQRLDRRRAVRLAPADRRGRARQRRPRDVRGQGGGPRPRRMPRRRAGRAGPARQPAVVDGRDPRRARRGAAGAAGAADHGPRERRDRPVRAAAAHARPARRADLAGRVPARRRALRPDRRDRQVGGAARDPRCSARSSRARTASSSRSTSPGARPATPSCSS